MKASRIYFAVIIDEYGGLTGIITLHDLIEALVGNLDDLAEQPKPEEIEQLGENKWCIQGYASLFDAAEKLGIQLPVDIYDTFNGFVCGIIDRVPGDGECFECESHGLKIKVHTVQNHRIGSTTVSRLLSDR